MLHAGLIALAMLAGDPTPAAMVFPWVAPTQVRYHRRYRHRYRYRHFRYHPTDAAPPDCAKINESVRALHPDALKERLVDELGGFEQALEKARELGNAPGAEAIRFTTPLAFGKLVRFLSEAPRPAGKLKVEIGAPGGTKLQSGRLYFLSPALMP
jgi:hypothetical protein